MLALVVSLLQAVLFLSAGVFADTFGVLKENVAHDGVVYADDKLIDLAFSGPRNFTVAMLLTSDSGKIDCQYCRILGPNFKTLASGYSLQTESEEPELFFVLAELESTVETFKKLGLTHVPNLAFYPPTKSKGEAKQGLLAPHSFVSFVSGNDDVEYMANVFRKQGFQITIPKPFPVVKFVKLVITLVAIAVAATFFQEQLLKIWQSKKIWLSLSMMSVVMFISGHMYNVTRGTSYMGYDGNGFTLVEPGFGSQLGVETQIVATLYALLAFTTIGLIKFVPKLSTAKAQTFGAVFGAVTIVVVYSIFLETFKIKMGAFPISILPIKLF